MLVSKRIVCVGKKRQCYTVYGESFYKGLINLRWKHKTRCCKFGIFFIINIFPQIHKN